MYGFSVDHDHEPTTVVHAEKRSDAFMHTVYLPSSLDALNSHDSLHLEKTWKIRVLTSFAWTGAGIFTH